jgi:hypothetical protein
MQSEQKKELIMSENYTQQILYANKAIDERIQLIQKDLEKSGRSLLYIENEHLHIKIRKRRNKFFEIL